MFDIDYCTFEFLSVAKDLYDYGLLDKVLKTFANMDVCEDYYSLAWEGIANVFEDFRQYFVEETQIETLVFFDPVITDFYRLCVMYETKNNLTKEDNPYRQDGEKEVGQCFYIDAYDYGTILYDGSHGGPRLVILSGEEFYGHAELPRVLSEVKETFEKHCKKLKKALITEIPTVTALKAAEKEAA